MDSVEVDDTDTGVDDDEDDNDPFVRVFADLVDDKDDVDVDGDTFVFICSRFVSEEEGLRLNFDDGGNNSDCDLGNTWRYFNISVDKDLENLKIIP